MMFCWCAIEETLWPCCGFVLLLSYSAPTMIFPPGLSAVSRFRLELSARSHDVKGNEYRGRKNSSVSFQQRFKFETAASTKPIVYTCDVCDAYHEISGFSSVRSFSGTAPLSVVGIAMLKVIVVPLVSSFLPTSHPYLASTP